MKIKFFTYRYFLLTILIIILLNLVATKLFRGWRVDMTETKAFALSPLSKTIVSELKDPIRIKLFFSKNAPAPYDKIESYLREILSQYKSYAGSNFTYEFFDATIGKDENADKSNKVIEMARKEGIRPVSVEKYDEGSMKMIQAYMGMVVEYGSLKESIPAFTSLDLLEFQITSILNKVVSYQKYMQNISENIEVALYLPEAFVSASKYMGIQGLPGVENAVKDAVEENNRRSYGKLTFKYYKDYENDKQVVDFLDALGVNKLQWQTTKLGSTTVAGGVGHAAIVLKSGEKTVSYELLQKGFALGNGGLQATYQLKDMSNFSQDLYVAISSVLNVKKTIMYLSDKGTPQLMAQQQQNPFMQQQGGDDLSGFNEEVSKTYTFAPVKLEKLALAQTKSLVIVDPKEEMTDAELFQLDQFVMKGGNLILFYNPHSIQQGNGMGGVNIDENKSRLTDLLKHYGVSFEDGFVFDVESYEGIVPNRYGQREKRKIPFIPYLADDRINHSYGPLKYTKNIYLGQMAPIVLDEEKLKGDKVEITPLFQSSPKGWSSTNFDAPLPMENSKVGVKHMGYLLDGKFDSYFAEQKVTDNVSVDEVIKRSTKPSKILIVSSSEVLKSSMFDRGAQALWVTAVLNMIDDVAGDVRWSDLRNKINVYPLAKKYDDDASFWEKLVTSRANLKVFHIFFVPSLILFVSIYMWYRRKKRKKEIDGYER